MKLGFRAKLFWIVGSALVAFVLVLAGGRLADGQRDRALTDMEQRLIPKLTLGQRAEADFERLRQEMQNAVAAQDESALEATAKSRNALLQVIAAPGVLDAKDIDELRRAIERYHTSARAVSARLIAGETGEKLGDDIASMQRQQEAVTKLIKGTAGLNQKELAAGFVAVRSADEGADRMRAGVGLFSLILMLGLSFWFSRDAVKSVEALSSGIARFASGKFDRPIIVNGTDEFAQVAVEANAMAMSLDAIAAERGHVDWLKNAQAGLSEELRGELDPDSVAKRSLAFLAERTDAVLGLFYSLGSNGVLAMSASHALPDRDVRVEFRLGEGLVGEAAQKDGVTCIDGLPDSYFHIRSGLGETVPRSIALVPLVHGEQVIGLIELAFLREVRGAERELLDVSRPILSSVLASARSSSATRTLLVETQEQAARLTAQEEELRVSNQGLQAQQEELRRANEELESQRELLSEQNSELDGARSRLQQKAEELARTNTYKSQFLANMSHELRTPLNSMLLLSHLLSENEDENLTEKQVLHCKTIHSAGGDLLGLINQVLDLAKIEAGRQDVELSTVPLQRLVGYTRRVFEPLAAEKGLRLRIEIADGLPESIRTDAQRLERVLTNLVGNAIKFTEHGEVALRIGRPSPSLLLEREELQSGAIAFEVSDTGIGIAADAQERVFAPFEQIESRAARRYAGSGLGLAIARESVTLLGGELLLKSIPGKGSTFTCVLPLGTPRLSQESRQPAGGDTIADDRASIRPGDSHLLVVEDDPVLGEQLVEIIRARRIKVVIARTGSEGLRLAKELRPSGIVLDVKLPDIDGFTVMERLREEVSQKIPVHFVSGLQEAERGLSMGAIGYLTKPATRGELVRMVRTLSASRGGEAALNILVVEDDVREGEAIVELLAQANMAASRVTTATAALDALGTESYACLILDLGLPDMDGLELLETLNARELKGAPAVVVHTGRALTKRETRELEAYASAVVLKDGDSAERLVDEVRLFVRHLEAGLTREQEDPAARPLPEVSFAGTTILLAEDDMRTAYAVSALLRSKGAEVLLAETGIEVLDLLGRHPEVRGVLMDVMMPEMDGYEAMRRVRADARFVTLPVIALTAKAMKGERERCLAAGASDYLTKPVDAERLLSTLRTWLGGENAAG
jgi:CheY-like chemotaxis protein/signal transduction histidine kinase